ncbi:hypothetical protein [Tepidibacter aestuarii]|uniref:hypothetical protein n=1 Tax=Tepidibacter aestuarii TaxID=2925782 RepID=UPI0020BE92FD|nr:hypothetical protein [Tepidibacter aestuarii]CAH2214312.1 protein of unknown function [Tepidibacter aestuarii]
MSQIINRSFDQGFTGWTLVVPPGATATTPSSFLTYTPINGNFFALLKTDGPGSYTTVSQSFYAKKGDKISGWAFFKANDYLPYDDKSKVVIKSGTTVISTVFSASVSTVGDYGQTPWTFWEYVFTSTGTFTLEGNITNALDSILDSYLGLDAIQLIRPPARGILLNHSDFLSL